jgi:hypothetical protein
MVDEIHALVIRRHAFGRQHVRVRGRFVIVVEEQRLRLPRLPAEEADQRVAHDAMAPVAERIGAVGQETVRVAVDVQEALLQHVVGVDARAAAAQSTRDRLHEGAAVQLEQQREHLGIASVLECVHEARVDPVVAFPLGRHRAAVARRFPAGDPLERDVVRTRGEFEQAAVQGLASSMTECGVSHRGFPGKERAANVQPGARPSVRSVASPSRSRAQRALHGSVAASSSPPRRLAAVGSVRARRVRR